MHMTHGGMAFSSEGSNRSAVGKKRQLANVRMPCLDESMPASKKQRGRKRKEKSNESSMSVESSSNGLDLPSLSSSVASSDESKNGCKDNHPDFFKHWPDKAFSFGDSFDDNFYDINGDKIFEYRDNDNRKCMICFESIHFLGKHIPKIQCYKCEILVHTRCFGISMNEISNKYHWMCSKCKSRDKSRECKCVICGLSTSIRTQESKYFNTTELQRKGMNMNFDKKSRQSEAEIEKRLKCLEREQVYRSEKNQYQDVWIHTMNKKWVHLVCADWLDSSQYILHSMKEEGYNCSNDSGNKKKVKKCSKGKKERKENMQVSNLLRERMIDYKREEKGIGAENRWEPIKLLEMNESGNGQSCFSCDNTVGYPKKCAEESCELWMHALCLLHLDPECVVRHHGNKIMYCSHHSPHREFWLAKNANSNNCNNNYNDYNDYNNSNLEMGSMTVDNNHNNNYSNHMKCDHDKCNQVFTIYEIDKFQQHIEMHAIETGNKLMKMNENGNNNNNDNNSNNMTWNELEKVEMLRIHENLNDALRMDATIEKIHDSNIDIKKINPKYLTPFRAPSLSNLIDENGFSGKDIYKDIVNINGKNYSELNFYYSVKDEKPNFQFFNQTPKKGQLIDIYWAQYQTWYTARVLDESESDIFIQYLYDGTVEYMNKQDVRNAEDIRFHNPKRTT